MLIYKEKAQPTPLDLVRWLGLFSGDVAEWLKALVSQTGGGVQSKEVPPVGSNPIVSANKNPDGSANFHRGNLTTQPKAMRSDKRTIRLLLCGLNRRVQWKNVN